jgi:hypothetical protein
MKHFTDSGSRFIVPALCLAALSTGFVGCSSSSDESPGGSTVSQKSGFCETEDDSPDFHVGWTVVGAAQYSFEITQATPATPVLGTNTWQLHISKPDGTELGDDAAVELTCSMPTHSHGCGVTPTLTRTGPGLYQFTPLIFSMPKHWDVRITVTDGKTIDAAAFPVCIS